MKRNTRRAIFYACVAGFVLLGAALTTYAFGYSFDYVNLTLVKTGSLTLTANTTAEVYSNDRLVGQTSLLGNGFSQSRLLPRSYTIRVQATDYYPWQKTVAVKAGFYLDFPHVVLVPRSLTTEPVASGSFTMPVPTDNKTVGEEIKYLNSPDDDKTLWFTDHEIWLKWLADSSEQPLHSAGDTELLTRYAGTIRDVQWYRDSAHIIVSISNQLKFFETDPRGGLNSYDLSPAPDRFYYDSNNNRIYLQKGQILKRIQFP